MSMAVCAKMVSGDLRFGPKIHIAFPRDFSNRLVMDITDEINDFLAERLGGGGMPHTSERAEAHKAVCGELHGGHGVNAGDSELKILRMTGKKRGLVALRDDVAVKGSAHEDRFASDDDGGSEASASSLDAWPGPGLLPSMTLSGTGISGLAVSAIGCAAVCFPMRSTVRTVLRMRRRFGTPQ